MNNTHSAFIKLPGGHAFIDGIPDVCKHDKGEDLVYQSASGKMIYWYTYRQWASYNEKMRSDLIMEHHEKIDDPIVMCTTQCRLCKKIHFSNMFE